MGIVLYTSGSILGASVFSIPFQTHRVGLLPMAAMMIVFGALMSRYYPRVISMAQNGGRTAGRSNITLGGALANNGAGPSGRVLGSLTAALLVIPGSTGYALIAISALERVSGAFAFAPEPATAAALVAAACYLLSGVDRLRSGPGPALALVARWSVGVAVVEAFGLIGVARTVAFGVAFTAGVFTLIDGAKSRRQPGIESPDSKSPQTETHAFGLDSGQAGNVSTLIVQLCAMGSLAALAVGLAWGKGSLSVPTMLVWPQDPVEFVTTIGIILFGFTATGLMNIGGAGVMRSSDSLGALIRRCLGVVVGVQLLWMIAVTASVDSVVLQGFDDAGSDSTAGVAQLVADTSQTAGVVAAVVAAVLVLFGVSAGANSHCEMLTNEWFDSGRRAVVGPSPVRPIAQAHRLRARRTVLTTVASLACVASVLAIPTTVIIGSAGLLGSAGFTMIIPMLADRRRQRVTTSCAMATVFTIGLAVASTGEQILRGSAPWLIGLCAFLACVYVAATAATAVRVPNWTDRSTLDLTESSGTVSAERRPKRELPVRSQPVTAPGLVDAAER